MRKFYAHIFGQAVGPLTPEEIKQLAGFNRGTMVYPENLENGTSNDWKPAFQTAEFGAIPFTPTPTPTFIPSRKPAAQNLKPESTESLSRKESDFLAEKARLKERIASLEKELEKFKIQAGENENLKIQMKEKDQRIYELLQETKRMKESPPVHPGISQPAPEPTPVYEEPPSYLQFDVPVRKIAKTASLILGIGLIALTAIPGSLPNKFLKNFFAGSKKSQAPEMQAGVVISTPTLPQTKPSKTPSRVTPAEKVEKKSLTNRETEEHKILQKYKQVKSAQQEVNAYLERKISMNESDPNFQPFLDAQSQYDSAEKEYQNLIDDYKKKYGEETWKEFVERVRNSRQ